MPTAKEVGAKLAGFTLADKVEEVRGKYQLKKKDCETYRERTHKECIDNDRIIALMRHNNRLGRILLAQDENVDERVIKTVFQDNREERLSLQRCTAEEAINEMDQKVCEAGKALNALRYERGQLDGRLVELREELERTRKFEKTLPEQINSKQNVTQIENELDKALIKYDTAYIISQRYKEILERMTEESLTLPARLDTMEQALLENKKELRELKVTCQHAVTARDAAKLAFQQVEHESYQNRHSREAEIVALRKRVEKRQHGDTERQAEREKKSFRTALLLEQQEKKLSQEMAVKKELQYTVLKYDTAMQKIKQTTFVNDIHEVVGRVLEQQEITDKLQTRINKVENARNRQRSELAKLRKDYHDMKYSGDLKLANGRRLVVESEDYLNSEKQRRERMRDSLKRNGALLADVRVGVATLMDKLGSVKLKPPHFSYVTNGDVFDEIALCKNKIAQLLKDQGSIEESAGGVDSADPEFQEFLEKSLPEDNVRVRMESSTSDMSEFDFNCQDNEVMGRAEIKNMSQKLIDSREKKPKKKKGKKK